MKREGNKTEWAGCDGDWHDQHSNTKLILLFALHFPLILPRFHSRLWKEQEIEQSSA